MLDAETNARVTETDASTPCGEVLRRYWQPAALSEELFDVTGACLEQPGEPAGSTFHQKVRQPSYPRREVTDWEQAEYFEMF